MFWTWFKKKEVFGHNVKKWHYLGSSRVKVKNSTVSEWPIHFFMHKRTQERSYFIAGPYADRIEEEHPFVLNTVIPWTMGEGSINSIVYCPSEYIKGYMFEEFGMEFDDVYLCWIQRRVTERTKEFKTSNNVVYLNPE